MQAIWFPVRDLVLSFIVLVGCPIRVFVGRRCVLVFLICGFFARVSVMLSSIGKKIRRGGTKIVCCGC